MPLFIILDAWGLTPHTATGLARKSVEGHREEGGRIVALLFARWIAGLTDMSLVARPKSGGGYNCRGNAGGTEDPEKEGRFPYCRGREIRVELLSMNEAPNRNRGETQQSEQIRAELRQAVSGTILIVDDDAAYRKLMVGLLRMQGFEVFAASDGEDALTEFAHHEPDLVLLDVDMPRLNGFEVCRRLKQKPESRLTPVVLVTGLAATEDRIRGLEAGADDFLSKPVDRNELLARVRSLLNLKAYTDELERAESVVFALARSIEGKDPYTEGHCERLAEYCSRLGRRIGLPAEQITALRWGGIVHDIGKVAVSEAILLKPGPLSADEWIVMRQHPLIGERICSPLRSFRWVLPIIRHHHERYDGSGYPDGLQGEKVPITARVLQIADVYDALSTERPYKRALAHDEAMVTMDQEVHRGWWDPSLFAQFRQMMAERREFVKG